MTNFHAGHYIKTAPGRPLAEERRRKIERLTILYAECRNALDPEPLIDQLAEDVVYEAQDILTPIQGKPALSKYLRERWSWIASQKGGRDLGKCSLGKVGLPAASDYPCVIFEADGKRPALYVVKTNAAGLISRIDILTVAPHPSEAEFVYP